MSDTLLVIHILAVAVWFGGILALSFAASTLQGADAAARRWFADAQLAVGRIVFSAAGILTLITGIWLVIDSEAGISMGSTFVSIGFAVVWFLGGTAFLGAQLLSAPTGAQTVAATVRV